MTAPGLYCSRSRSSASYCKPKYPFTVRKKQRCGGDRQLMLRSSADESDDGTFGTSEEEAVGVKIPGLSAEQAAHVNRAETPEEFRRRLKEVMTKVEGPRRTGGSGSSENYIESLRRNYSSENTEETDDNVEERGFNKGESYIRSLARNHEERASSTTTTDGLVAPASDRADKSMNTMLKEKDSERMGAEGQSVDLMKKWVGANVSSDLKEKTNQPVEKERLPNVGYIETPSGGVLDLPPDKATEFFNNGWSKEMQTEVMGQVSAIEQKIANLNQNLRTDAEEEEGDSERSTSQDSRERDAEESLVGLSSQGNENGKEDVATLDKKIAFIEQHLKKIETESKKEPQDQASTTAKHSTKEKPTSQGNDQGQEIQNGGGDKGESLPETDVEEFSRRLEVVMKDAPQTSMSQDEKKEAFKSLFKEIQKNSKIGKGNSTEQSDTVRHDVATDQRRKNAKQPTMRNVESTREGGAHSLRDALISMRIETNMFITKTRMGLNELEDRIEGMIQEYAPDLNERRT